MPVSGEQSLREREVTGVLVAGMTADHVLERLRDGMAVITPGDRSDVVLAVASAHAAEGFPSLSCIVLNGGLRAAPVHRRPGRRTSAAPAHRRHRNWAPTTPPARRRRPGAGSPPPHSAKSTPRWS